MNRHQLNLDLNQDELLLAVRRRKRKRLAGSMMFLGGITTILFLTLHRAPPRSQDVVIHENKPPTKTAGEMEIIKSDEELLDLLQEFGPVLVDKEDGTQLLLLTANN